MYTQFAPFNYLWFYGISKNIKKPIGGNIMNALDTLKGIIGQLTALLVATVGLGVVAGIVFGGDTWFVGAVLDSLLDVVRTLGENGLVGLLVAAMLIGLLK